MPYTTANGTTEYGALDYYPKAAGTPEARIDSVLRRAERIVRDLAPPPDTLDSKYSAVAADTELAVFEYLLETSPHAEREQTLDRMVVYRGDGLEQLVRQSMGSYYVGPRVVPPNADPPAPPAKLTNVSPDPLW